MKLTISKQDAIDLFSEKYKDTEIEDVIFIDEDGNPLTPEISEVAEEVTEEPEVDLDDETDYEDGEFESGDTAEDFVDATGIVKVLKKALEDQGYKSRIPSNPTETCEAAAEDFLDKLKRRDRRIVVDVMRVKGIKKFLLLWQDYQNFIHKKL